MPGLGSLSTNILPLILECPPPLQGPGQHLDDPSLGGGIHKQPKPLDKHRDADQALAPSQPPSPIWSSCSPLTRYSWGSLPYLWPLPASPPPSWPLHFLSCHQRPLEIKDSGRSLLPSALCQVSQPVQSPKGQQGPKERKSVPVLCSLLAPGLLEWPPAAPGPRMLTEQYHRGRDGPDASQHKITGSLMNLGTMALVRGPA
ncbi:uncharacterized protein LOC122237106 [Panthera tigris]|uniref:uncharacterized protein LOC122237106 n=1 Tax=Panthera tigris TaxID=9694 RepID=UPI001C6F6076|nr:uncharacterized protein LOC122237106 [Panthera tigris]